MVPRRTPPRTLRAASQERLVLRWSLSEMAISIGGRRAAPRHFCVCTVAMSVDPWTVKPYMKNNAVFVFETR